MPAIVFLLGGAMCPLAGQEAEAQPGGRERENSPRYTATVRVLAEVMPAVASVQTLRATGENGGVQMGIGSASVIHESGYLLTNDHVISGIQQGQVLLPNRGALPFRVVAAMSSEDLALIKVDSATPLQAVKLGRSHDLMLGEPTMTIGNPAGLVHSVSSGIVSGLNRSAAVGGILMPWMIQTSAAVSGGNSGGPLINALGEQIGVITSKKLDGENINFAIAIDRVREMFPALVSAELRSAFQLGVTVDMYEQGAKVVSVLEGSPAEKSGIRAGDMIDGLAGGEVRNGVDFHLALIGRKVGDRVKLDVRRGSESLGIEVELGELVLSEPVAAEGMAPGIRFEGFEGRWDKLPEFGELEAVSRGRAEIPSEEAYMPDGRENYALRFQGFLKIPREDLYTFYTSSDDGSRLKIAGRVVVNNDGLHGVLKSAGMIRLKQGLHPVEVTFFEQSGDEELEVLWESSSLSRQVVPADAWFSLAD